MIKFVYALQENVAGFTIYIDVPLDTHRSVVILGGVMKFCPDPF